MFSAGRSCYHFAIILSGLAVGVSGNAADHEDKFLFEAGTFLTDVNTTIAVDSNDATIGTSIDLEEYLGYKNDKRINRINAQYRVTPKHSVHYSFFKLDRSKNKTLERTLIIDGEEYPITPNNKASNSLVSAGL